MNIAILALMIIAAASCAAVLVVKDVVVAAACLVPAACAIAGIAFLLSFSAYAIVLLLIYVGVVVTFIIVAATAVEKYRPFIDRYRVATAIVTGAVVLLLALRIPSSSLSISATPSLAEMCSAVVGKWFYAVVILLVFLATMVLAVVQLCRRGQSP